MGVKFHIGCPYTACQTSLSDQTLDFCALLLAEQSALSGHMGIGSLPALKSAAQSCLLSVERQKLQPVSFQFQVLIHPMSVWSASKFKRLAALDWSLGCHAAPMYWVECQQLQILFSEQEFMLDECHIYYHNSLGIKACRHILVPHILL